MRDRKICGTCRFHLYEKSMDDWWCSCMDGDHYLDFTGYADCENCEDWEARDGKNH